VLTGVLIVGALIVLALLAPILARHHLLHDPLSQEARGLDADGMPLPPGRNFLLGTDNLGRDVLSRVVFGARVSLAVGLAAMITATVIGVAIGLLAAYYGKGVDMALMRCTDVMMSIPALLLAVAFAGLMDGRVVHLHPAWLPWHFAEVRLQPGLVSIFLIIGLVSWTGIVRVVRGQALVVKEREYIMASRALGGSDARLILRHILPNVLPTIIVLAALSTAGTILLEAGLSYLGIGVPPPAPSWGSMIADGQPYFIAAPHIVMVPGVAIVLTVVGFNLLGQGLQDALDPHRKSKP
jgi:ABC-type dipeptide/oligopeptide/nickel transport system permease subunit